VERMVPRYVVDLNEWSVEKDYPPEDYKKYLMEAVNSDPAPIVYKYSEDKSIREITDYIASTYSQHYAGQNQLQAIDIWEALGSCETTHRDNAMKYLYRYSKKNGRNRKDLLKAVHYILFLMHYNEAISDDQSVLTK
jgi:hypothetical protein